MRIIWSPLAIDRVSEIALYIAQDDITASEKWIHSIFNRVEQLIEFPESGRTVPETRREDIRELLFRNHRIIYRIRPEEIAILTIRHTKQILPEEDIN